MMRTSSGVVSGSPSSSSQNGTPRFLGVKGRLVHPVVRPDVNQVEVSELLWEILERHPTYIEPYKVSHWLGSFDMVFYSAFLYGVICYQNSPSLRTRTDKSSLSRSDSESHSQERSDQGPLHSPRPQGFLRRTSGTSPRLLLRTRANPVTL